MSGIHRNLFLFLHRYLFLYYAQHYILLLNKNTPEQMLQLDQTIDGRQICSAHKQLLWTAVFERGAKTQSQHEV